MGEHPEQTGEKEQVRCVPLCAASRVYTRPQWWQHEASCPVRVEYLERRAEALAETAKYEAAETASQEQGR